MCIPGTGSHGAATMRAFQNGEFRALCGLDDFARAQFTAIDSGQNDSRGRPLRDGISKFVVRRSG